MALSQTGSAQARNSATAQTAAILNRLPNAALVFADGTVVRGIGFGAEKTVVGELCFNTSITGYQEILTDPSYAGQIITFTFPHIGNVGANPEDVETNASASLGCVVSTDITEPSNWRAAQHLDHWLKTQGLVGLSGIDTRALTRLIRAQKAPSVALCHGPAGETLPDSVIEDAKTQVAAWPGLEGMDLAAEVSTRQRYQWQETPWVLGEGFGQQTAADKHVVAIDFGAKKNILRCLAEQRCNVTVVPADSSAESILALKPDGIFLSNGPGDPAATGVYAVPTVKALIETGIPIFGICLGHQILAQALGATTQKMAQGHRGGNHPVKDLETGAVEITSQNHGFVVDEDSLPKDIVVTHRSLFDGTNEGLRCQDKPVFSVQYHPEANPGPQDSHYLFSRFRAAIDQQST